MKPQECRDSAISALAYADSAIDSLQMIQYTQNNDIIRREIETIQRLIIATTDRIRDGAGIKDHGASIFLPAFPKATQRHL